MKAKRTSAALPQLLLLASSNLPIGSYSYSQGIESAIENGLITDEASALAYLQHYQQQVLFGSDLVILAAMRLLLERQVEGYADSLAQFYQTSRDSYEFMQENQQLAQAFAAWINAVLALDMPTQWIEQGYLPLLGRLGHFWNLAPASLLEVYRFSQMENLTLAAVKTLPLGQMAGQRMIWDLQQQSAATITTLIKTVQVALNTVDVALTSRVQQLAALLEVLPISTTQPQLGSLSCQHEQQYSRLFRS